MLTLLVVDDEPAIREALTRSLQADGYRILSAESGEMALELLAHQSVQVIIADEFMPGMGGVSFLNTVAGLYPLTVRILMSGYTDPKVDGDELREGVVFQFISKPWDEATLREDVRDAFRQLRAEAEA